LIGEIKCSVHDCEVDSTKDQDRFLNKHAHWLCGVLLYKDFEIDRGLLKFGIEVGVSSLGTKAFGFASEKYWFEAFAYDEYAEEAD
jgi:hypothetical protein